MTLLRQGTDLQQCILARVGRKCVGKDRLEHNTYASICHSVEE